MDSILLTITGIDHYLGAKPFKPGRIVRLRKEPDNEYDTEAIVVELPYIDTIGYIANSVRTVFGGTVSAGRLYDRFDEIGFAEILVITPSGIIARFVTEEEVVELRSETLEENPLPDSSNTAKKRIGF